MERKTLGSSSPTVADVEEYLKDPGLGNLLSEADVIFAKKRQELSKDSIIAEVKKAANLILEGNYAQAYFKMIADRLSEGSRARDFQDLERLHENSAISQTQKEIGKINEIIGGFARKDTRVSQEKRLALFNLPIDSQHSDEYYRLMTAGSYIPTEKNQDISVWVLIYRIAVLKLLGFELNEFNQIRADTHSRMQIPNLQSGHRGETEIIRHQSRTNPRIFAEIEKPLWVAGRGRISESIVIL